ncbi:MAG: hypothetical protein AAFW81_04740 [Pseudomonadota bacterium]
MTHKNHKKFALCFAGLVFAATLASCSKDEGEKSRAPDAPEPRIESAEADDDREICLTGDLDFLPGDQVGCHSIQKIKGWRRAPLEDSDRGVLSVSMTHPTDRTRDPALCRTCADYRERLYDGYYAMSGRDRRREAFFIRACGVIEMLLRAAPGGVSHFDGGVEEGEIASIGAERMLQLGDDPRLASVPGDPSIERIGAGRWRVAAGGQTIFIEEIAELDFDADGVTEILAFLSAGPVLATARVNDVALLEKDSENAPLRLTALKFQEN